MPAGHSLHVSLLCAPVIEDHLPAAHLVHSVAPSKSEYVPAPHCLQSLTVVLPLLAEYVPASQSTQALLPCTALNLPLAQREHTPPSGPVDPALHLQSDRLLLPDGESERNGHAVQVASAVAPVEVEYFPDPHSLHGAVPGAVLNLPALHWVQGPPLLPLLPALHRQASLLLLAAGEDESVGQSKHDDSVVALSVFEYFPEPQLSHALAPALALNFPAIQAVHVPPFGPQVPGSHKH